MLYLLGLHWEQGGEKKIKKDVCLKSNGSDPRPKAAELNPRSVLTTNKGTEAVNKRGKQSGMNQRKVDKEEGEEIRSVK